ncbi:hypothetical protein CY34DRAFT_484601 [Suillus luteus UH-Slu-Lm8-n1]|uniref:Uncharacterized protein n=1 Tax=Suillus luteus UH-Slu-Lm8-n1 TaxID=930992 RepID=A0A0C9ZHS2_9AGAM|nr:hypothetical protein CY34DRAFT_484601 [Suillus luteus UH-Slu-Lm8-n1]
MEGAAMSIQYLVLQSDIQSNRTASNLTTRSSLLLPVRITFQPAILKRTCRTTTLTCYKGILTLTLNYLTWLVITTRFIMQVGLSPQGL